MAAIRMIAKMPTLAAFAYRHSLGLPYVYPDNELDYPSNFLSMLFKKTEIRYEPDPRLAKALDVLFILHADNVPDFLQGVKNREERLMGFGHRVYKNYDPRARIIQQHMDDVFEATEYNPLVEIAQELEKRALDDEYFTDRKLYPNVDFYSGIIYEALQIPTEMFTVIFAIPRTSGWVAQWMEGNDDSEQKIARPRQVYIGERDRDYVSIEERDGPEKITGPPARRPKRQRRGA